MSPKEDKPFILAVLDSADRNCGNSAHDSLAEAMALGELLKGRMRAFGRRYMIESLNGESWELAPAEGLAWRKNDAES
jgi:hypothetical protein